MDFYRSAENEIGLRIIYPGNRNTAGWKLGVEKSELGSKKQEIHRLLASRADPSDITQITGLVSWVSKLLTSGMQGVLAM